MSGIKHNLTLVSGIVILLKAHFITKIKNTVTYILQMGPPDTVISYSM